MNAKSVAAKRQNLPNYIYHRLNDYRPNSDTGHLRRYSAGSSDLNTELWHHKNTGEPLKRKEWEEVLKVSKANLTSKPLSEPMSVYTGVKADPRELAPDGIIHIPSFISTSLNPAMASDFTDKKEPIRHVIKIFLRKGQHVGSYIADTHSSYPEEQEFLINPNHVLHINDSYDDIAKIDGSNKRYTLRIHHAIILRPHEMQQFINHPEVQSHLKMQGDITPENYLKMYSIPNHKNHIELGRMNDANIKEVLSYNGDALKHLMYQHQTLPPHIIGKIVYEADEISSGIVAKHQRLSPNHVQHIIDNRNHHVINQLLTNKNTNLTDKHYATIIDRNPDAKTIDSLLSQQLSDATLTHLINKVPHIPRSIYDTQKLSDTHLTKLYEKGDANVFSYDNVPKHLIETVLASNHPVYLQELSKRKDLTPSQYQHILKQLPSTAKNLLDNNVLTLDMAKSIPVEERTDKLNAFINLKSASTHDLINQITAHSDNELHELMSRSLSDDEVNKLIDNHNYGINKILVANDKVNSTNIDHIIKTHGKGELREWLHLIQLNYPYSQMVKKLSLKIGDPQ